MISQSTLDTITQRTDIVEIIQDYIKLKKEGDNFRGLCPFHNEKTPSFTVNKVKNLFKCFGCGKSGDAIQFLSEHTGKSFIEVITLLCNKYNIIISYEENKVYDRPVYVKKLPTKDPIEWFKRRGISEQTLIDLKVSQDEQWMPLAEKIIPVICFDYYREGELINIKYRGANKDFKLYKNAELIFYNLDAIQNSDTAIIVEGEIDALTLHECGYKNVVSVPNGAATGNQKLTYLDNCWQYFENKKSITIITDNDPPGQLLRDELARRFGKNKCLKVKWPEGIKDANELLLKHGKQSIVDLIHSAEYYPIEGITTMDDMYADVVNYYENGYPKGFKTHAGELDEYLTFLPGQITVVTGIPGSGKSEYADYLMAQLTILHNWNWAVCSFENQPSSYHVTKLMEKFTGKSFQFRKDFSQRINKEEADRSIAIIDNNFTFININAINVTLTGILQKTRELVTRKGISGLIIDPWNYIEHHIGEEQTETQYISECLTELKVFALQNNIHIFLIAHPTKIAKDKRTGKFEIPNLYNISGSAHFFNKTDNGLCIWRDFETGVVDVYIQKVRYSWLGKTGFTSYNYDTFTRQYIPI